MKRNCYRIELHSGTIDQPFTSIDWYDARTLVGALVFGLPAVYRRLRQVTSRSVFAVYVTREAQ